MVVAEARQELLAALVRHEVYGGPKSVPHCGEKGEHARVGAERGVEGGVTQVKIQAVYKPVKPRCRTMLAMVRKVPLFW